MSGVVALAAPSIGRPAPANRDGVGGAREVRDHFELLTTLIDGPGFDPVLRGEVLTIPADHAVFPWSCVVLGCRRPRWASGDLCAIHSAEWGAARAAGADKAGFVAAATPLELGQSLEPVRCRICPRRPAFNRELGLCHRHRNRWGARLGGHRHAGRVSGTGISTSLVTSAGFDLEADFALWLAGESAFPGYGPCRVQVCEELAESPLGLCTLHLDRYRSGGRPGGARLPGKWFNSYERLDRPVPLAVTDPGAFAQWCTHTPPVMRLGQLDLRGLSPLPRAEIQWGLHAHGQGGHPLPWPLPKIQTVVEACYQQDVNCLADIDTAALSNDTPRKIVAEILAELRLVYVTPSDTRRAGYVQTQHHGVVFPKRTGYFSLSEVPQQWLRDLLWDHLTRTLRSPRCPRSASFMGDARRACVELGTFLRADAPEGGHVAAVLTAEHAERFVAEVRRRERLGQPALALRSHGSHARAVITQDKRRAVFNGVRKVLREALEAGDQDQTSLDRGFITAIPPGGRAVTRARRPLSDEVARALAEETNLARLAAQHDPTDRGLRDVWETLVCTGRRASEVITLRLECLGRHNGLPMLWHDQTKVGRYDQAIRIPETLHTRLTHRRNTTLNVFAQRNAGRPATASERSVMALFPTPQRNRDGRRSLSYSWFQTGFSAWISELDLGPVVAHQARHTLATRLLRHGATLSHIRRYLGHVSDRMAEHYAQVAVCEIEDVLAHVWVTGPGAAQPGTLIAGATAPLDRAHAQALAVDLARASTPTPGGFCTFQPVVEGNACPWKLDCENCDKFVLSGADLLYWRRKREQWRSIAERAPDDATADYLHQVFEPTASAINGLENALAGLGLLDDALALDLRRPQDYFHRLWTIGFRPTDLAAAAEHPAASTDTSTDTLAEPA